MYSQAFNFIIIILLITSFHIKSPMTTYSFRVVLEMMRCKVIKGIVTSYAMKRIGWIEIKMLIIDYMHQSMLIKQRFLRCKILRKHVSHISPVLIAKSIKNLLFLYRKKLNTSYHISYSYRS